MDGQCLRNYLQWKWKQNACKFDKTFIINYDEDSDKGYIIEVDVKYPKIHNFQKYLPFLPERMKINKCKKLVFDLYDKKHVVYIRALQQALNHGLERKTLSNLIKKCSQI